STFEPASAVFGLLAKELSCAALSISRSMESFRPLVARLNSERPFPKERPNSGRRFGPNTSNATTKITSNSGTPILPMETPHLLLNYSGPARKFQALRPPWVRDMKVMGIGNH